MANLIDMEKIEQAHAEAVQRMAEAAQTLERRQDEADEAEAKLDELRDELRSGDESVTAQRLANATANVERCALLLEAAEAASRGKLRSGMFVPHLAILAASVMDDSLPIEVHSVEKLPSEPLDGHALPVAYVAQPTLAEPQLGGFTSGRVSVVIFRSPLHAIIGHEQVAEALEGKRLQSVEVNPPSTKTGEDIVADSYRVDVRRAWLDEVPVIANVQQMSYMWQNGFPAPDAWQDIYSHAYQSHLGAIRVEETKLGEARTKSDGTREIPATATYWVNVRQSFEELAGVQFIVDKFTDALRRGEGSYLPGLGKVESVSWSVKPTEHRLGRRVEVQGKLVSRAS